MDGTIEGWARLLHSVAGRPRDVTISEFRDEMGNRRGVDVAFFAARSGAGSATAVDPRSPTDERFWWACAGAAVDVARVLQDLSHADRVESDRGALIPQGVHRTIEVWTETEFASLHALSRLGLRALDAGLIDRALNAARWHIGHTQPDNATNRPWAVHLFALLAAREGDSDAALFAETLLHNCRMRGGAPDVLSGHILTDSAQWLEAIREGLIRRSSSA